jgi:hypothetical protein
VAGEHYYHFSPAGIATLLNTAGYQVTAIQLLPLGYSWNLSCKSVKELKGNLLRAFCYLISRLKIGFPYQPDQMYVLADRSE